MTKAKTARNPIDRPELRVTNLGDKRRAPASIDMSRARVTKAKPFVDLRFAPDKGHVGEFSKAGIGRYLE